MCGRFFLAQPRDYLERFFSVKAESDRLTELQPSYNIPPTRRVPAVSIDDGEMTLDLYRWGLIPSWADASKFKATTINARSETVATKPMYRSAFKSRRCLIPADGFYEWQRTAKTKQPYAFVRKDGEPMAFAGLWEAYKHEDEWIRSCTILTTANNEDMPIHDRLPLILERRGDTWERWLDPDLTDRDELEGMIHVAEPGILRHYPVDKRVGSVKYDDEQIIAPIELTS